MDKCCSPPNASPSCLGCLKLTDRQGELEMEIEGLLKRIHSLEVRLQVGEKTTSLLMSTYNLLQKREKENIELKKRLSSLENDELVLSLKSKLQYVQSMNLCLQEELSSATALRQQLDDAKAEIARLTSLVAVTHRPKNNGALLDLQGPVPLKRTKPPSPYPQYSQRLKEMSSMPQMTHPLTPPSHILDTANENGDELLLLSENDLSIFSEEMADVLGTIN